MRRLLFAFACLFLSLSLYAQEFEPMEYDGLKYRQLFNNPDSTGNPALVVFLHGGHARGDDNLSQIKLPAVNDIKDYILKNGIPAYFLVPQCPASITRKPCSEAFSEKRLKWLFSWIIN